jgi:hypothetical protein
MKHGDEVDEGESDEDGLRGVKVLPRSGVCGAFAFQRNGALMTHIQETAWFEFVGEHRDRILT